MSSYIKMDELVVGLPEASNFVKKSTRCKNLKNINKEKKVITRKLEYLNYLAEVGVTGFSPKSLNPIIKAVAEKINDDSPPTWRTLIRWAKKYINNNENADSLTDNRLNNRNCSYFIGKTPSSEFFATVLLSCSSGEMNLANKI